MTPPSSQPAAGDIGITLGRTSNLGIAPVCPPPAAARPAFARIGIPFSMPGFGLTPWAAARVAPPSVEPTEPVAGLAAAQACGTDSAPIVPDCPSPPVTADARPPKPPKPPTPAPAAPAALPAVEAPLAAAAAGIKARMSAYPEFASEAA